MGKREDLAGILKADVSGYTDAEIDDLYKNRFGNAKPKRSIPE